MNVSVTFLEKIGETIIGSISNFLSIFFNNLIKRNKYKQSLEDFKKELFDYVSERISCQESYYKQWLNYTYDSIIKAMKNAGPNIIFEDKCIIINTSFDCLDQVIEQVKKIVQSNIEVVKNVNWSSFSMFLMAEIKKAEENVIKMRMEENSDVENYHRTI